MGIFRRNDQQVPALVPIPPIADLPTAKLQASARYLGTWTVPADGSAAERVIGQSLSAKSAARLVLSAAALDVVRIAGSFRIRGENLVGARNASQFAGKPVTDLLVVRWEHGGQVWDTGFRMDGARSVRDAAKAQIAGASQAAIQPEVAAWVRSISKMSRQNGGNS